MKNSIALGWKLGLLAILTLLVGLGEWRQYLKYQDGRGFYPLILGADASGLVQILVFVALPAALVLGAFFYVLRDFK